MYPSRACTSVRPRQRATNMKSQTFQLEWSIKLHVWSLKSMLWSIYSCQNRISADHYHMTVLTHRSYMTFEGIRWTSFQLIAGSTSSGSFSGLIYLCFISSVFWNIYFANAFYLFLQSIVSLSVS